MSLQLALLLIGLVIIAIVALTAYDKGRLAKSMRRGFRFAEPEPAGLSRREPVVPPPARPEEAALLEAERKVLRGDVEVPLDSPASSAPTHPLADVLSDIEEIANRPLNLNPGFDPPGTGPEAARERGVHVEPDEAIDFIIHLPGPGPVSRRAALAVYKQNEYKLEYPRQLYGRRYQTNFWSVVQHDSEATQYSDLKLAIQLVEPRGPISESELNAFVQVSLKMADSLHRVTKLSMPFETALARAKELQAFYDEYDVIAGVNVLAEPHAPFKGRTLLAAMERVGMQLDARNIFNKRTDGRVVYSVANLAKPGTFPASDWDDFRTTGLAVYMSVPGAKDPAAVFDRMIETAKELTRLLGARLADQDQRPLTDKGIAAIRGQIQAIDAKMRAFGIPAGSDTARRLFAAD